MGRKTKQRDFLWKAQKNIYCYDSVSQMIFVDQLKRENIISKTYFEDNGFSYIVQDNEKYYLVSQCMKRE